MRAIPNILLYYLVGFACLGAVDVVASYQFSRSSSTSTSIFSNHKETQWSTNGSWNQKIDDRLSGVRQTDFLKIRRSIDTISVTRIASSPSDITENDSGSFGRFTFFAGVSFLYWYLLVLGAAAQANGLPVPDFIPMVPGWPVSDSDLAPVLEDSYHFFYLSDLLNNPDAPIVSPPRLAIFNLVEAWIFAMLPALWRDESRRLSRPVLLVTWLALGINLTNAFLAPYLAITELRGSNKEESEIPAKKNSFVAGVFAAIAIAVVGHAASESFTVATAADWADFAQLAKTDRSYLAFCVDPVLFAIFQPLLLARIKKQSEPQDYIPFLGLMFWLLLEEKEE